MSPLSGFLAVIVSLTAILVAYLTKQFQNENLNYSSFNQMKNTNTNTKVKTIEKEKVVRYAPTAAINPSIANLPLRVSATTFSFSIVLTFVFVFFI